jgi:FtsZ-binding cell division protein ZapB
MSVRRPKASRPRGEREYVADTIRLLDLAIEDVERQGSRLRSAAREARSGAERLRRTLREQGSKHMARERTERRGPRVRRAAANGNSDSPLH